MIRSIRCLWIYRYLVATLAIVLILNYFCSDSNNARANANSDGETKLLSPAVLLVPFLAAAAVGAAIEGVSYAVECIVFGREWDWYDFAGHVTVGATYGMAHLAVILFPNPVLIGVLGVADVPGVAGVLGDIVGDFFRDCVAGINSAWDALFGDIEQNVLANSDEFEQVFLPTLEDLCDANGYVPSAPCFDSKWADFRDPTIWTRGIDVTTDGMEYNSYYGASWRMLYPGISFLECSFNLPCVPEGVMLSLTHLTSADEDAPNGGYSPVDIYINDYLFWDNYDVAENHNNSHSYETDQWEISEYLVSGQNSIRLELEDDPWAYTHYWIQTLALSPGFVDMENPDVTLLVPNDGGTYGGLINVVADASDDYAVEKVKFEYSLNHSSWYDLVGPDSPDGYDYYGDNGWSLRFDSEEAGITYDGSVWVRAKAFDYDEKESGWDECDQSFVVDNTGSEPTSINVTTSTYPNPCYPYESLTLTGAAYYNTGQPVHNATATMTMRETGAQYTAAVVNGGFSAEFPAPGSPGSYHIDTEVDDGSLPPGQYVEPLTVLSGEGGSGYTYGYDVMCRDIESEYPWDPIYVINSFEERDEMALCWVQLDMVYEPVQVKYEWYTPSGNLFQEPIITDWTDDPQDQGYPYWEWYRVGAWGWYLSGAILLHEGMWEIRIFARTQTSDWTYHSSQHMTLRYDLREHVMCKDVEDSYPYDYIEPTNTFLQTDTYAYTWMRLDTVSVLIDVMWEFYEPNGSQYTTFDTFFVDPESQGYDFYYWYKIWGRIWIDNYPAEDKCGNWSVNVFIKDAWGAYELVYQDYFQILENPNIDPFASASLLPQYPNEVEPVSLNISASDNTYIQKVTLYYSINGTDYEQTWDDIFSSTFSNSVNLGTFPQGTQIQYHARVWDTSDNDYVSNIEVITIVDDDVVPPSFSNYMPEDIDPEMPFFISLDISDPSGVYDDNTGSDGEGAYLIWDVDGELIEDYEAEVQLENVSGDTYQSVSEIPGQQLGAQFIYQAFAYDNDYDYSNAGDRSQGASLQQIHTLPSYAGPIWYVSPEGDDVSGNGSESFPFATIQRGVDASSDGDTVLVERGTYVENADLTGKQILLGSRFIISNNQSDVDNTIVDAGSSGSVLTYNGEYGQDSVFAIKGLTLENGFCGIEVSYGNPILSHTNIRNSGTAICGNLSGCDSIKVKGCQITGNEDGINLTFYGYVEIDSCLFENNSGSGLFIDPYTNFLRGSVRRSDFVDNEEYGIWIYTTHDVPHIDVDSCTFDGNGTALWGGVSVSNSEIRNGENGLGGTYGPWSGQHYSASDCIFENLSGWVFFYPYNHPYNVISDCIIRDNGGEVLTGGVAEEGINFKFENCKFTGNEGDIALSGWIAFTMSDCVFSSNSGSVIFSWEYGGINISGNTLVDNNVSVLELTSFGTGSANIANNIIAENTGIGLSFSGYDENLHEMSCNDVFCNEGGNYEGIPDQTGLNGNISIDTRFCNPEGGDYQLAANSPCAPENNSCGELIGALPVGCDAIYRTWYVSTEGDDVCDNGSQENPFRTIQFGVNNATDGDTVTVANGTYSGDGNRDLDLAGRSILLNSENGAEFTIVDCDGSAEEAHRGIYVEDSEGGDIVVVDGFTIANGYVEGSQNGGGIKCSGTSMKIINCYFIGNESEFRGGGLHLSGSSFIVRDCVFSGNSAWGGGGISIFGASLQLQDCLFDGNIGRGESKGGGIFISYSANTEVVGCKFTENDAERGGAIYCDNNSSVTLTQTLFNSNLAYIGGGIYCDGCSLNIVNCTLSRNDGASTGGGLVIISGESIIANTIIWNNSSYYGAPEIAGSAIISYSDVLGGWEGEGNINVIPRFVDADNDDYRLAENSICRNAGENGADMGVQFDSYGPPQYMIVYVDSVYADSVNVGTQDNPYARIQDGIDGSVDGDTVFVASGTYIENIDSYGKGILLGSDFIFSDDSLDIENTIIDGNQTGYVVTIDGGQSFQFIINGFVITHGGVGGIRCMNSNAAIRNNIIIENAGMFDYGGISCYYSTVEIYNNRIYFNNANVGAGILCSGDGEVAIERNIIAFNTADCAGGGIHCVAMDFETISIVNNTIYGNSAVYCYGGGISINVGGDYDLIIKNSIVWGNDSPVAPQISYVPEGAVTYCDVQDTLWPGEGNISEDPSFADAENRDFRLNIGSPCIDRGDPSYPLDPDGSIIDMGAVRYDHGSEAPAQVPSGPGDELVFEQNGDYIGTIIVNDPGDLDSLRLIRYYIDAPGLDPDDPLVNLPAYYGAFAYPEDAYFDLDITFIYTDSELAEAGIDNEFTLSIVESEIDPLYWQGYPGSMSIDPINNAITAHNVTDLSLWSIIGDPTVPPPCVYTPGDVNHNGAPLELADVIAMIGNYRGTVGPYYTCDCGAHGPEFAAVADPNGNCVAFELGDVVTEIGAYRGTAEASGCPDCPGSLILFSGDGERLPVISPLRPKVKGKENFLRE